MADNNKDLMRDIGANLQDRLVLDHSLPAIFVSLLADLDAAEDNLNGSKVRKPTHHEN